MLPLTLLGRQSVTTSGLLDSGAAVNVLPHALVMQLRFDWNQQTHSVQLSGNLATVEARVVVLSADEQQRKQRLGIATEKQDIIGIRFASVPFEWFYKPDAA